MNGHMTAIEVRARMDRHQQVLKARSVKIAAWQKGMAEYLFPMIWEHILSPFPLGSTLSRIWMNSHYRTNTAKFAACELAHSFG